MDKTANCLWKAAKLETRAEQAQDQQAKHAYTAMAETYRKLDNHVERRAIILRQEANERARHSGAKSRRGAWPGRSGDGRRSISRRAGQRWTGASSYRVRCAVATASSNSLLKAAEISPLVVSLL